MTHRTAFLLILFGLLAACGWSYRVLAQHRGEAHGAAANLGEAQRFAARIEGLRGAPARVAISTADQSPLTMIAEAADTAGVPRERIVRIDPQPPRRVGTTDFSEQLLSVELRGVTLAQLVGFVEAVELGCAELTVRPPHQNGDGSDHLWNAELTLTRHLYAPTSAAR